MGTKPMVAPLFVYYESNFTQALVDFPNVLYNQ
jgi:hypothetical protein